MTVVAHALLVARVVLAGVLGLLRVVVGRLVPQTVYRAVAAAVRVAALHVLVVVAERVLVTALAAVANPAPQTAPARVLVVVQVLTDGGLCDQSQDYSKPSRYGRRLHYNRTGKQLYR
ncbi:hypothetical protein SPFM17_00165 [Salmonella phage SPFM17]|nr:hypothetical protein SPFM4_00153 [Salmonella phage SPFM4]VFR12304.1 hypothetical protein SPFM11_00017 [Salmonella phage SPFM11]VFR12890.1 hypothetical protein SPFM13_00121 [Salmonella phage SPFM13]VFR14077.1 hypothetical protein SPFM17_00165 [Salmonella phage SPFM17]VFR14326.1 hypothetical protein SPFM16_00156 [Salmonella phage SPFM16]VFR14519.1 hypothetical protein SPFM19_00085 [Salmonella phage SPFM19]VFR15070.1 hypothetical protein SPFM22_00096 [Salmonella phage SPFM22]VFR15236.1 hypot